ncbi:MAG: flippase-like domain-containing protein [Bacteroidales bacterium]|nr:flippase-like domain-containing protein [Bacteroidales bacterium]
MPEFKHKKVLFSVIKAVVVLAAWIYIAFKLKNSTEAIDIKQYFAQIGIQEILLLATIVIMMIINWLLEAIKWRNLVKNLEKIGLWQSFKAVWAGVTVGTLTPNRIGEFGGRIIFLRKENRTTASGYTLYGDLSQFLVTFIFGLCSFLLLIYVNAKSSEIDSIDNIVIIIGFMSISISSIIYFRLESILKILKKIRFFKKLLTKFDELKNINLHLKLTTLSLSAIRYLVFTTQFYFALIFFGIEISYFDALISISSVYLAATIIPNIPFAELGIRLSFSIIFIGIYTNDIGAILMSSLLIYIINVAIPTLIGGIFMIIRR